MSAKLRGRGGFERLGVEFALEQAVVTLPWTLWAYSPVGICDLLPDAATASRLATASGPPKAHGTSLPLAGPFGSTFPKRRSWLSRTKASVARRSRSADPAAPPAPLCGSASADR